jgi:hypothetical protein
MSRRSVFKPTQTAKAVVLPLSAPATAGQELAGNVGAVVSGCRSNWVTPAMDAFPASSKISLVTGSNRGGTLDARRQWLTVSAFLTALIPR